MTTATKARVATVWLDGCSGCHMSFLDLDERLIDLAKAIDLVHSPVVDPKTFPENVDLTLIEGAVSSEEDLHKAQLIRQRSKVLVSLGDCAVTGNVPAMRNPYAVKELTDRAYVENATAPPTRQCPDKVVPPLLARCRPLHEVVKVDYFLPGCPPPADAIFYLIGELLAGRTPDPSSVTRFGK